MSEGLGIWLRRARESRDLTLEEAEEALRIRRRYLQALEMGDYAALPGEIQARGFLRNYARFIGLPVEEALDRYESEVSGSPFQPRIRTSQDERAKQILERPTVFAPPPTGEEEEKPATGFPKGLLVLLVGTALVFALIALGSFLFLQFFVDEPGEAAVTPTLVPAQTSEVVGTQADAVPDFVPAVDGTVTVRLEALEHAWVRVVSDGETVFQGVAEPGQDVQALASGQCLVETGNGGAFQLYINDEDFGLLGERGVALRRAWSPAGEVSLQGS